MRGVCALIINPDGKILVVSRKYDHTQFGLPGGKVEEGESHVQGLIRELKEETGLTPMSFLLLHKQQDEHGYDTYCYLVHSYAGVIGSDEDAVIKWLSWEKLLSNGPFIEYNKNVYEKWKAYQKFMENKER